MRVTGNLGRPDTDFAGEVIERYNAEVHGFQIPMVKVVCDDGRTRYAYAKDVTEVEAPADLAYAVEYEDFSGGQWQGFTVRCLRFASALDRYNVYSRIGASRNIRIVRDAPNDGQPLCM